MVPGAHARQGCKGGPEEGLFLFLSITQPSARQHRGYVDHRSRGCNGCCAPYNEQHSLTRTRVAAPKNARRSRCLFGTPCDLQKRRLAPPASFSQFDLQFVARAGVVFPLRVRPFIRRRGACLRCKTYTNEPSPCRDPKVVRASILPRLRQPTKGRPGPSPPSRRIASVGSTRCQREKAFTNELKKKRKESTRGF